MAQSVIITFKDGTQRQFHEVGRPGGSYTISVKYQDAFVIVTDEYGQTTAFPSADIRQVETTERPRW